MAGVFSIHTEHYSRCGFAGQEIWPCWDSGFISRSNSISANIQDGLRVVGAS